MPTEKNPTVAVAKEVESRLKEGGIIILADGNRGKIVPVSAALIEEVTSRIQDPPVPTVWDEERQRNLENPGNPDYLRGLADANRKRGLAAIDAMVMFGLELLDGIPQDETWLKKLRLFEKRGMLDLTSFDLSDPIDLEFLYKRYIAADNQVLEVVSKQSGVTGEAIEQAEKSFPGS